MATSKMSTLGVSDVEQFGLQELDSTLVGSAGADVFDQIRLGDPTGKAMYEAMTLPIRKSSRIFVPGGEQSQADIDAAAFAETCFNDFDQMTFDDWLSDVCLMFGYGWSQFWMVMKRRTERNSEYPDGKVGFSTMEMVLPRAVMQWQYDDDGRPVGPEVLSTKGSVLVPLEGSLLFRTTHEGGVPTGVSIFRPIVRTWKYKRRLEVGEGIGLTRRWKGFPTLTLPDGATTIAEEQDESDEFKAQRMLEHLYNDRMMGAHLPDGWVLDFGGPKGTIGNEMSETIARKDAEMSRAILAHFIMLGLRAVGSQALAETLLDMFIMSAEAFQSVITGVINKFAMKQLFIFNPWPGITGLPELKLGSPRTLDLRAIGAFINLVSKAGVFTPNAPAEEFLRSLIPNMPTDVTSDPNYKPGTSAVDSEETGSVDNESISQQGREPEDITEQGANVPTGFSDEGGHTKGVNVGSSQRVEKSIEAGQTTEYALRGTNPDKLVRYNGLADSSAKEFRQILTTWSEGLSKGIGKRQSVSLMGDSITQAVLAGMSQFRTASVRNITSAFHEGYGSTVLEPEALMALSDEIHLADQYIGYLPDGSLSSTNPEGRPTLFGAVDTSLRNRSVEIYSAEDEETRDLITQDAVKGATGGYRRSELYAGNVWHSVWNGARNNPEFDDFSPVMWSRDAVAQSCGSCLSYDGQYPNLTTMLGITMGALPGYGTECGPNCRCTLYAVVDGVPVVW